METAREEHLLEMVRQAFTPAAPAGYGQGSSIVEVRGRPGEAVLVVRWDNDPHLYGIPVPLTDVRHEFYYSDYEVSSDEEWLESVSVGLDVMLGTGHRATARRTQVGDYIELRAAGGWPVDERFYLQEADYEFERLAEVLREAGLDPTLALRRRSQDKLLVWLLSYENNATGGPWVGQAVVTRGESSEAELELVETTAGVPVTVRLDLAYFASHAAAERGARTVSTALPDREFALAGFAESSSGARVLDTSFLGADPDGARALLEASLAAKTSWGQDRDAAGRYLPASRLGRLWHRLRWGASGRRPRIYAG
jgi:hypothetical protein